MIDAKEHPVAWVALLTELDEAQEHLEDLAERMRRDDDVNESEFAVQLGHVFAHLNRAWHSRNQASEISEQQWPTFSQFPQDLAPIG